MSVTSEIFLPLFTSEFPKLPSFIFISSVPNNNYQLKELSSVIPFSVLVGHYHLFTRWGQVLTPLASQADIDLVRLPFKLSSTIHLLGIVRIQISPSWAAYTTSLELRTCWRLWASELISPLLLAYFPLSRTPYLSSRTEVWIKKKPTVILAPKFMTLHFASWTNGHVETAD